MWEIYKKEFLELARDKRTLIFTILLPTLIMPLIIGGVVFVSAKMVKKAEQEVLTYTIVNEQAVPELAKMIRAQENFKEVKLEEGADLTQAIQDQKIKFAVVIPEDARSILDKGEQIQLELYFNNASVTNRIYQRVKSVVDEFSEGQQKLLLAEMGLTDAQFKGLTRPVDIKRINTADKREDFGEKFGGFFPYILLILTLTGAMYPALDLGVGEKERGTLETLLLTPVSRTSVVLAKFLVIFTTGFLTVFMTLASLLIWMLVFGQVMAFSVIQKLAEVVHFSDILLMFVMLAPVAAIFASLLLCTSIYAKNFKEAQNYMSPIMMLSIIPIIFSILPGVKLDSTWAWVPLTNVALAIKEILKGTIDYGMLGIIFISTTLVAGVLLYFSSLWFNREAVLFRS
jgi:sodium transport system permease protein